MELALLLLPYAHRSVTHTRHFASRAENRTAEFHTTFDDAAAIGADGPLERLVRKRARGGGGVEKRELVEPETDLGVVRVGDVVELAEALDMRGGERGVGLKALEEDDWRPGVSSRLRRKTARTDSFGSN